MKVGLDPYMLRSTPPTDLPGVVTDLGYQHIELSPREDFIPFFNHPRVDDATVRSVQEGARHGGVCLPTTLPCSCGTILTSSRPRSAT